MISSSAFDKKPILSLSRNRKRIPHFIWEIGGDSCSGISSTSSLTAWRSASTVSKRIRSRASGSSFGKRSPVFKTKQLISAYECEAVLGLLGHIRYSILVKILKRTMSHGRMRRYFSCSIRSLKSLRRFSAECLMKSMFCCKCCSGVIVPA